MTLRTSGDVRISSAHISSGISPGDIGPSRKLVVYPGREAYPIGEGIEVMSLAGATAAQSAERRA